MQHGAAPADHGVLQGTPEELYPGSKLRLGASTRAYMLQPPQKAGSKRGLQTDAQGPDKRVRFGSNSALEQIIGYSDGRQDPGRASP